MRQALFTRVGDIFDRLNELANGRQKPVVVASEPIFFGPGSTDKIISAIAEKNSVCYSMPHQAASALASLAQYSEYLKQDGA